MIKNMSKQEEIVEAVVDRARTFAFSSMVAHMLSRDENLLLSVVGSSGLTDTKS
jgi:hypothetical protein